MKTTFSSSTKMPRVLLWQVLICLALTMPARGSVSGEMYRWEDENGKVHFGDRQYASGNSQKMEIRESQDVDHQPAKEKQETAAATGRDKPISDAAGGKTAKCAEYARNMVRNQNKREWVDNADKIKAMCPSTGFECTTIRNQPAKSKCEPFAWDGRGSFFKEVTRDFPIDRRY